jgi:hypothetical protein
MADSQARSRLITPETSRVLLKDFARLQACHLDCCSPGCGVALEGGEGCSVPDDVPMRSVSPPPSVLPVSNEDELESLLGCEDGCMPSGCTLWLLREG